MEDFEAKRVSYSYTQTNDAPPDRVFPLLCPVREVDWIPGWKYRMIYSRSGVAEEGCVFSTPNELGPESIWMVTHYDPATLKIHYDWVRPGLIAAQLRIALEPAAGGKTSTHLRYQYTGLSLAGNAEVDRLYSTERFQDMMQRWETAINYYLRNGKLLQTTT